MGRRNTPSFSPRLHALQVQVANFSMHFVRYFPLAQLHGAGAGVSRTPTPQAYLPPLIAFSHLMRQPSPARTDRGMHIGSGPHRLHHHPPAARQLPAALLAPLSPLHPLLPLKLVARCRAHLRCSPDCSNKAWVRKREILELADHTYRSLLARRLLAASARSSTPFRQRA